VLHIKFIPLMFTRSIILTLSLWQQVQGARLGSPKDNDRPTGWAWKDSGHHSPPGHLAKAKPSDKFQHAWAGKAHSADHVYKAGRSKESHSAQRGDSPDVDIVDKVPGAAVPRKVIKHRDEDSDSDLDLQDHVTAKYQNANRDVGDYVKISKIAEGTSTDLQGTLEKDCHDSMTLDEFMPKCLKHTKSLIADLDYNYGDAQLETILRNWCSSAKEFPNARGTRAHGFKDHQSCTDFADDLKNARYFELKSKSDKGYKNFCNDFYGHHGGHQVVAKPPAEKEEVPAKSDSSWMGISMVVVSFALYIA